MIKGITVGIFTSDFDKLTEFYRAALGADGVQASPNILVFSFGDSSFYIHRRTEMSPTDADSYDVNFNTDDIATDFERFVNGGARVEHAIKDEPFGKVAGLADPQGHEFDLVQER